MRVFLVLHSYTRDHVMVHICLTFALASNTAYCAKIHTYAVNEVKDMFELSVNEDEIFTSCNDTVKVVICV